MNSNDNILDGIAGIYIASAVLVDPTNRCQPPEAF
jgi:hypothetical protein